jgi:hypothetical protein
MRLMVSTGSISSSLSSAAQSAVAGIKQHPPIERARATSQAAASPPNGGGSGKNAGGIPSSAATGSGTPAPNTPRGSLLDISI